MNDAEMSPAQPVPEAAFTGRLRRAREAAGLHVAVMATMLKVPVRKLEALEAGRLDELPDITFARALASSACRHLKIDPEPILAELPGARPATLVQMATDDKPAFRAAGQGALSGLSASVLSGKPAVWAAVLLLGLAAGVYFWPATPPSGAASDAASDAVAAADPPAVEMPNTSDVVLPPAAVAESGPASAASAAPAAVSAPPEAGVGSAQPAVAQPATTAAAAETAAEALPAVTGKDLLTIVGRGDSWLEVSDAQGRVLLRRMLRAGEVHKFNTQPPYRVLLGNANAAEVRVRGRAFDLQPHLRNSVARFEVQ